MDDAYLAETSSSDTESLHILHFQIFDVVFTSKG